MSHLNRRSAPAPPRITRWLPRPPNCPARWGRGREQRSIKKEGGPVKETPLAPRRHPFLTHRSPPASYRGTPSRALAIDRVRPSPLSVPRGPAREAISATPQQHRRRRSGC
ncbi:hypothetical protein NDU88_006394 [Pleurodeles waltl]|uniref:Uncharacterized protein n=1 Tax=Pleurodeles waltl TaxID=8319 RepID=A0AAV7UKW0_PLEWA|nr:hypothetical protein NDU88_006394 [Pleurodeles waltl]